MPKLSLYAKRGETLTVEVLRRLERLLGAGRDQTEEFFYVADRDNARISYVSSSWEKIWGQARADLAQEPLRWMQSIHPEDLPRLRAAFASRATTGNMDIRYRIVRRDNQVRYIHDRAFLIDGTGGEAPYVVGRCRDISAEWLAAENLQRQLTERRDIRSLNERIKREGNWDSACAHLAELIRFHVEADAVEITRRLRDGNFEVAAFAGHGPRLGDVIGAGILQTPFTAGPNEDDCLVVSAASEHPLVPRMRALGAQQMAIVPVRDPQHVVRSSVHAFYVGVGEINVSFALAIMPFIDFWLATQEHRSAIEDREAMFREMAETIDGIFWSRAMPKHGAQYISPAFWHTWSTPGQSLTEASAAWYGAIHPDDTVTNLFTIDDLKGQVARNYRLIAADGSLRWIQERAYPVHDAQGALARIIGFAQDVTERHAQEAAKAQLAAAQLMHREANLRVQARDEALSVVSHDLRNPLTLAQKVIHMLDNDAPLDATLRARCVDHLSHMSDRMNRLLDDLLDSSRLEAGHLSIEKVSVNICELLRRSVAPFRPSREAAAVSYSIDAATPETMLADPHRLLQMLSNLVTNAVKFTDPQGRVEVRVGYEANAFVFVVADTGCGLTEAQLTRLFDKFWQASRRDNRGVGLGLSIVRGIVEAHGGTIEVTSAPNVGTTFTVRLPKES